ncbi:MAG: (d)CMP kinase [Methylococcales bacterium]
MDEINDDQAPVLTIDGPSGAGKGTVSRSIAKILGWHYLDSGAIYRAMAVAMGRNNVSLSELSNITQLALSMNLEFRCEDSLRVYLEGEEITDDIQTEQCGKLASQVAAISEVRSALLEKQHEFQRLPGLVADGRDMGTIVFPSAPYKIFLTANPLARAKRRYKQLKEKGISVSLNSIVNDLEERDKRDIERVSSPLCKAEGALFIDSTDMSINEVIEKGLSIVQS